MRLPLASFAFAAALAVAHPASAADNQLRLFFGGTFGGGTSLVDFDHSAGKLHKSFGVGVASLGNIFGVDVDVADMPGFFQNSDSANLVLSSRADTFTGSLIIAAPRSKTEYGIRPYLIGGGGITRTRVETYFNVLEETRLMPTFTVGVGALGFLTNRVGVSWELRRFESLTVSDDDSGTTINGKQRLSFWRASMAFVYRY
jgi:Outer membrane protein beta-barrel domain